MTERKFKHVGTRPIRHDGLEKVTGRANFGADFALPGMLHGAVLRSPHAHARILSIDLAPALAMPGVKAAISGADLPDIQRVGPRQHEDMRDLSQNIIARDKVLYHGHAVAAVAAKTFNMARRALEEIVVEYEELPPVLDIESAPVPPTWPGARSSRVAISTRASRMRTWWWSASTSPPWSIRATSSPTP